MPAVTALHHTPLQTLHKKHVRRGEEPNYCELSAPGSRLQRLYVLTVKWHLQATYHDMVERSPSDVADLDASAVHPSTVYDLIANVTHESAAGTTRDKESTIWKVQLRAGAGGGENDRWYQIQSTLR